MSTVFHHPNRKTFYHRSQIPKKLRRHFKGRVELWRSLKTEDKAEATLKSAQWTARIQQLFLTLRKRGDHMTDEQREALVSHWLERELDEAEDARTLAGYISDSYMALNKRGSWGLCWLVVAVFALPACSHQSLQEPVPSFTSVFPYETREVGNYSVDDHTKAPLQWVVQAWVKTDAATLYAKSINLEGIAEHVTWNNEGAPSVGAQHLPGDVRTIPFAWMNAKERLLITEPVSVHFYTLLKEESSAPTPMDHYLGVVTTELIGKGSVITWRVYYDTKGWSPMASIMSSQLKRLLEKGIRSWIDEYGGVLIPIEVKD